MLKISGSKAHHCFRHRRKYPPGVLLTLPVFYGLHILVGVEGKPFNALNHVRVFLLVIKYIKNPFNNPACDFMFKGKAHACRNMPGRFFGSHEKFLIVELQRCRGFSHQHQDTFDRKFQCGLKSWFIWQVIIDVVLSGGFSVIRHYKMLVSKPRNWVVIGPPSFEASNRNVPLKVAGIFLLDLHRNCCMNSTTSTTPFPEFPESCSTRTMGGPVNTQPLALSEHNILANLPLALSLQPAGTKALHDTQ
jgi:hypothetical protein